MPSIQTGTTGTAIFDQFEDVATPASTTMPPWEGLRVPAVELDAERWRGPEHCDVYLDVPETAALLRAELRRHFPGLRATVAVTHKWHGWIRVRVKGQPHPDLQLQLSALVQNLTLMRFDSMTDEHWCHQVTLERAGFPVRVSNPVRSIDIEWAAR